jgi:hypothetical protein
MKKHFLFTTASIFFMMNVTAQHHVVRYDPPGERKIHLLLKNSNVTVIGYDSTTVAITAVKDGATQAGIETDLKTEEKEGVLYITKLSEDGYSYTIKIPYKARLQLTEEFRGPRQIVITGVKGAIAVKSWVSKITLKDVTGPLDLFSQSADIFVHYATFNSSSASEIVTPGRSVEIVLPPMAGTDLKLDILSGKLISDIDLGAAAKAAAMNMGESRTIKSKLNGGGALLHVVANEITLH